MLEKLKRAVLQANLDLCRYNLVTLTWGNVSGIDRESGRVVIKPSGIPYEKLSTDDMVVVNLDGNVLEGKWRPSSDTPAHLVLYREYQNIGGIAHVHSEFASAFAQACYEIPCYGTTHADHFAGTIPVTRFPTDLEINNGYEAAVGDVIVERFEHIDPMTVPAVLVAGHAPFTWGKTPDEAVRHSLILEKIAKMALNTLILHPDIQELPEYILDKHYTRKHGPNAYYGQQNRNNRRKAS